MPEYHLVLGSFPASLPVQIAAEIAARLVDEAHKNAEISEKTPVILRQDLTGGSYPLARKTAKPGRFCDAMVTR